MLHASISLHVIVINNANSSVFPAKSTEKQTTKYGFYSPTPKIRLGIIQNSNLKPVKYEVYYLF